MADPVSRLYTDRVPSPTGQPAATLAPSYQSNSFPRGLISGGAPIMAAGTFARPAQTAFAATSPTAFRVGAR